MSQVLLSKVVRYATLKFWENLNPASKYFYASKNLYNYLYIWSQCVFPCSFQKAKVDTFQDTLDRGYLAYALFNTGIYIVLRTNGSFLNGKTLP